MKKGVNQIKLIIGAVALILLISFFLYNDLSTQDDLVFSLSDARLHVTSEDGEIEFSNSGDKYTEEQLREHIVIEPNFIEVDSDVLRDLNKPARLTLNEVPYSYPIILRDGEFVERWEN